MPPTLRLTPGVSSNFRSGVARFVEAKPLTDAPVGVAVIRKLADTETFLATAGGKAMRTKRGIEDPLVAAATAKAVVKVAPPAVGPVASEVPGPGAYNPVPRAYRAPSLRPFLLHVRCVWIES